MLRAIVPAVLVAAAVPAAAGATPKTETASLGAVAATFTYTDAGDGRFTGLRVTVTRDGIAAFDAAPETPDCAEPYCAPFSPVSDQPAIAVADLDGDGEPEVLVNLYTGGAHCCEVAEILRFNGTGYTTTSRNFADVGYTLAPAPAGGAAIFVTGDARFAYAFASFADSAFPVRLLTYGPAGWRDVTRDHPDTLTADAAQWLKEYKKRRRGIRSLGMLAAWVADEYRLGRQAKADKYLAAELRAGRLKGDRTWPRRRTYVKTLQRRLRVWGYTIAAPAP